MESRADIWRAQFERLLAARSGADDPRERLLRRIQGQPSDEFSAWLALPPAAAAVLVGLTERDNGVSVLLTKRAAHLPRHPGQISFPGGRIEGAETPVQAAFREAREEVGLAPEQGQFLAVLPSQLTGTGFRVTPVVALLDPAYVPVPDPAEVAVAFHLPIGHVRQAGAIRRTVHERQGTRFVSDEFSFQDYRVWGATAAILIELIELLDEKT